MVLRRLGYLCLIVVVKSDTRRTPSVGGVSEFACNKIVRRVCFAARIDLPLLPARFRTTSPIKSDRFLSFLKDHFDQRAGSVSLLGGAADGTLVTPGASRALFLLLRFG